MAAAVGSHREEPGGLPELDELQQIVEAGAGHLSCRRLCDITVEDRIFGVDAVCLGNPDPSLPAVGIFGGVHGLERIGSEVVLACLSSLVARRHGRHRVGQATGPAKWSAACSSTPA